MVLPYTSTSTPSPPPQWWWLKGYDTVIFLLFINPGKSRGSGGTDSGGYTGGGGASRGNVSSVGSRAGGGNQGSRGGGGGDGGSSALGRGITARLTSSATVPITTSFLTLSIQPSSVPDLLHSQNNNTFFIPASHPFSLPDYNLPPSHTRQSSLLHHKLPHSKIAT